MESMDLDKGGQSHDVAKSCLGGKATFFPSPFDAYIVVLVLYYYLFWQQLSQILKKGKGFVFFHFLFNCADGL